MKILSKTLFGRILLSFALTFLLVLGILGLILSLGYRQSTQVWAESRISTIRTIAETYFSQELSLGNDLEGFSGEPRLIEGITQDIPVFLYNQQQTLIATNRGTSRHRGFGLDNLMPVLMQGELVGFFAAGSTQFRNDASNQLFLDALINALLAGALSSLVIALAAGAFFSKSLVRPAGLVNFGIERFAQGDFSHRIPVVGTEEIAGIAASANALAQRLQEEQDIRAQWAQDITHDMRTPIASIRARLEAFLDGVFEPSSERLQSLLDELSRIEGLISDLEELTRLETPELRLDLTIIDLPSFGQMIEEQFTAQATAQGKQLHLAGPEIQLLADESLVHRAMSNLITNALQYSFPQAPIRVSWGSIEDKSIYFSVCNQGPAIEGDELQRIFARLYRGNSGRTTQGSGLGLTITAQILKLHHGEVQVTSTQEETCFRLLFPLTPPTS